MQLGLTEGAAGQMVSALWAGQHATTEDALASL